MTQGAAPQGRYTIVRQGGGIYARLLIKWLAATVPAPEPHVWLDPLEVRAYRRRTDFLWAIPMFATIAAMIIIQVQIFPWLGYSVLTGGMAAGELLHIPSYLLLGAFMFWVVLVWNRPFRRRQKPTDAVAVAPAQKQAGFLDRASLREEQLFRENSHRWSGYQRLVSCVVFGLIHMVNLVYPLATIIPIAFMGGVFMMVYLGAYRRYEATGEEAARHAATLRAAAFHRVYNVVAITVAILWIANSFVSTILGYFGLNLP